MKTICFFFASILVSISRYCIRAYKYSRQSSRSIRLEVASMKQGIKPTYWILGFVLAFVIIWCISFLIGDTLLLYTWSPDTGTWIRIPGSVHRCRSEGWGTSRFGQFDVIGVDDITKTKIPAIAIWGDSHVEAFNVEQWERMQEVLTGIWRAEGKALTAFGIGNSGESIADWYYKIPRYEKICPYILAHFIVLSGISDVLPDNSSAQHAVFLSKPEYHIIERNEGPEYRQIKAALRKCGLDFVWLPTKSFINNTKLRFALGPRKVSGLRNNEVTNATKPIKSFSFLLHALRRQTIKPIIFVYCPYLPSIGGGELYFRDPDKDIASLFAKECRRNGFGFIDMTKDFCNYYLETGDFPRGFPNSKPSQGHFNAGGHRLIAKAIYEATNQYTNRRTDAFHSN